MKEFYMRLPRDGYETILFMGIVSIISVNIIAPLISMLETGFSVHGTVPCQVDTLNNEN